MFMEFLISVSVRVSNYVRWIRWPAFICVEASDWPRALMTSVAEQPMREEDTNLNPIPPLRESERH